MADTIDIIVNDDDVVSVEISESAAVEVTVEDPTPSISFTLAEAAGGGINDHGLLGGLGDDDHTQYHNDSRGDARYFTKTEHLDSSAGAGDAGKPVKLNVDGEIDASMLPTITSDHGALSGLGDDDHPHYALADGSRWTGTTGTNNLPRVDAAGNLVSSDISFDGTNLSLGAGNNLHIPDMGTGSYMYIGTSLTQSGVLSFLTGSPNIFSISAGLSRLALIGANSLTLQAGGGAIFTWPVTDGSANHVLKTDGSGGLAFADATSLISAASDTAAGKVELATIAEVDAGTDTARAITPDSLAGSYAGQRSHEIEVFRLKTGDTETVTVGDGAAKFSIPAELNGWNLTDVYAFCETAGTTGNLTLQVYNVTQAADMLNSALTIASGSTTSGAASIDTANDDVASNDIIRIDIDTVSSTPQEGLKVRLTFSKP